MILANELVGAFLSGRRREALYRVHERPDPQAVELLLAKLADLGVPTPPVPERHDAAAGRDAGRRDLGADQRRTSSSRGAGARRSRRSCCARSSRRATTRRTSATPGSRARAYCHFTSPIRRYPDLVVHRALLRELGLADDPLPDDLPALAEHTSAREREAAKIEYLADEICLAWLLDRLLFERGWESRGRARSSA